MASGEGARRDPEVVAIARRRQFSGSEKRRLIAEAERCKDVGTLGAFLRRALPALAVFLLVATPALAQPAPPVGISVDLAKPVGPYKPIYAWFGYDEANFTTGRDGKKLLRELRDLSPVPVYIRAHHLLTSGDGTPGGSSASSVRSTGMIVIVRSGAAPSAGLCDGCSAVNDGAHPATTPRAAARP